MGDKVNIEEIKRVQPAKLLTKIEELPKDWKDTFFKLAAIGASVRSMHTSAGITMRIHERFLSESNQYKEWFEYCSDVSKAWWEDFGREICKRKDYNSATYSLIMRNRLNWTTSDQKPSKENEQPETQPAPGKTADDFKGQSVTAKN